MESITYHLQRRMIRAIREPVGIEHLEDPTILDRVALAQDSLMSFYPTDAPMTFADILADRIQVVIACAVIASFRWWMGLVLALLWLSARRPMHAITKVQVRAYTGDAGIMRRSHFS